MKEKEEKNQEKEMKNRLVRSTNRFSHHREQLLSCLAAIFQNLKKNTLWVNNSSVCFAFAQQMEGRARG